MNKKLRSEKNTDKDEKTAIHIEEKEKDPNYELKHFFIQKLIDNLDISKYRSDYGDEIYDICFTLFSLCQHSYELLRSVLDLPSISSIKHHFSTKIANEKDNLINFSNIPEIVHNYRITNNLEDQFDIILSVDACSFDRLNASGKKYCFCFFAQPINPDLKSFPVHITPTETGSCSNSIIDILYQIIEILKECDIRVIFTASDGDPGYNVLNDKTFSILSKLSKLNQFEEALFLFGNNQNIKHLSDMLHILKLVRKRLIQGDVTLNYDRIIHLINSDNIEKVLHKGKCLTDKSALGKMKDIYCLELFNFDNLEILFQNNMLNEVIYFLQYVCWLESVTNTKLATAARIELLHISFDVFYSFLNFNETKRRGLGITVNKCSHSIAQIFVDDNLIKRSINSIIATALVILRYKEVALDRIGTHVLENYFGQIRYSCKEFNSWENILTEISHGNIRTRILYQYKIQLPIYHRLNYGGIHIIKEKDESNLSNIPSSLFPIDEIQATFFKKIHLIKNANNEITEKKYDEILESFLSFINESKINKKQFYNPGPISSSRILSRYICEKSDFIEKEEKIRNSKIEKVIQNFENFYQKNGQYENECDFQVIEDIDYGVKLLNESLKQRTKELLYRSNFMSRILEYLGPEDDDDDDLMDLVDKEIVDPEMKRRSIADLEFEKSIREFLNTPTLF